MSSNILSDITYVSLDLIEPYPDNPRLGDTAAIKRSLAANEQFIPLVVQLSTGFILSGNHTFQAAQELGWDQIAVVYVDVDDQHAKRILLAANRISDLGTYDENLLASILADVRDDSEELLASTGYTSDEVDALLDASIDLYIPDFESEEDVDFAASVLDRIMPPDEDDEDDYEEDPPAPPPEKAQEFVIFRFGEFRAKVDRSSYDEFASRYLKTHKGDLATAGIAAALELGVDPAGVTQAIATGTERWL
jgi:ParB-like chromosome segregation protein Spo0J